MRTFAEVQPVAPALWAYETTLEGCQINNLHTEFAWMRIAIQGVFDILLGFH